MQIKHYWLNYQGLVSFSMQMREIKTTRKKVKSIYVCIAVVAPRRLCFGLDLSLATDLTIK